MADEEQAVRQVDPSSGSASQPGAAVKTEEGRLTRAYDDEADLTVAPSYEQPEGEDDEGEDDEAPGPDPQVEPGPTETGPGSTGGSGGPTGP